MNTKLSSSVRISVKRNEGLFSKKKFIASEAIIIKIIIPNGKEAEGEED